MEWPKIYRELCTWFTPLPLPAGDYPPVARERTRKACCGGRSYWCKHCGKTFDKSWNWIRHVKAVRKRQRTK